MSNGAVFMPNTIWMQELYGLYLEQSYYDALDDGEQVEAPYLYTVAKGKSRTMHPSTTATNIDAC